MDIIMLYTQLNKIEPNKYNMKRHETTCKVGKIIELKSDETKSKSVCNIKYTPLLCWFYIEAIDISHISEEKHLHNILFSSYELSKLYNYTIMMD
jgi:hypothetical protein